MKQFTARFNHNDSMYESWLSFQDEYAEQEKIEFNFDNVKARTVLAKSVIDWINEELKTNIEFTSMYFPREYNFETDAINVTFDQADFDKLYTLFSDDAELKELLSDSVKRYTTHVSGYVPFHTLSKMYKDKGLLMGAMLEVYNDHFSNEYEYYYDRQCIYDNMYNESVEG